MEEQMLYALAFAAGFVFCFIICQWKMHRDAGKPGPKSGGGPGEENRKVRPKSGGGPGEERK
jgi:hypothetical protein